VYVNTYCIFQIYFKNVHPKFPDGGKLTQYMEGLQIGDTIDVRGPNGLLVYKGRGQVILVPVVVIARTLPKANNCLIASDEGN
jgi:hypothetical protein